MSDRILKAVEFIAQTAFAAPAMTEAELGAAMARIARQCEAITAALASAPQQAQETSLPPWPTSFSCRYSEAAPSQPPQGADALHTAVIDLANLAYQHGREELSPWPEQWQKLEARILALAARQEPK